MPRKKFTKRKRPYKLSRRNYAGKRKGKYARKHLATDKLVIFNHPRMPFPPRYRTTFNATLHGYVTLGAQPDGVFAVYGNGLNFPFLTSVAATGTINTTPFTLLYSNTPGTYRCQGYSNLVFDTGSGSSGVYNAYRVFASKISWEMLPVTASDNVFSVIVPQIGATANATSSNINAAMNDRYAVKGSFTATVSNGPLTKFLRVSEIFGVPDKTVKYDFSAPNGFTSQVTSNPLQSFYWLVYYHTVDNSTTTANIGFRINVRYWVELFSEISAQERTN